jgi:hypothetical protein
MGTGGVDGFDEWLERELLQNASRETGPNPLPSQSRYQAAPLQGNALNRLSFALAAMVSSKTVTALALSAAVIVAAGATTEAVITRSANPTDWGHQVVLQVQGCKDALAPGGHGVGACVSSFASQHGRQESKTHGTSSPSQHPNGGPPSGQPAGGPPSSPPHGGPPSSPPHGGPPSSPPHGGPPSSHPSSGNAGGNSNHGGSGSNPGHVGKP